jgi:Fimbrial assembly protein (PilN)
MSQQINLLNPALIKQKDFFNSNNIAMTLGLLSVSMLGYYGYAQKELSALSARRSAVAEELSTTQAQLQQTALLHVPHAPNKALQDQIMQLEQKETMQQQILQTVNQSSATPDKGYAALMRAFSKQSLDGLWLTSFSFDSNNEKLNISGRTLQADLVPEYISHLGKEPALKGKLFSALNMSLPKVDAATAPVTDSKNGTPTATKTEAKFIEFALQSIDDKSVVKDEKKS